MRRSHAMVLLIFVLLLLSAWMSYDRSKSLREAAQHAPSAPTAAPNGAVATAQAAERERAAKEARVKRDALREEIVRHAAKPAAPSGPAGAAPSDAEGAAQKAAPRANEAPEAESPVLRNKMGPGRERLGAFLNKELSPLLGECFEQATARSPKLSGMFAIGIETLADGELGAVVDTAEPAARNEIADPEFFECVRESAFTLIIPPPLTTGQEKFELTGYFGQEPASAPEPAGGAAGKSD